MSIVESMNQTRFVCVFDISDINVLILPKTHVLAGRTFMFFFPIISYHQTNLAKVPVVPFELGELPVGLSQSQPMEAECVPAILSSIFRSAGDVGVWFEAIRV